MDSLGGKVQVLYYHIYFFSLSLLLRFLLSWYWRARYHCLDYGINAWFMVLSKRDSVIRTFLLCIFARNLWTLIPPFSFAESVSALPSHMSFTADVFICLGSRDSFNKDTSGAFNIQPKQLWSSTLGLITCASQGNKPSTGIVHWISEFLIRERPSRFGTALKVGRPL